MARKESPLGMDSLIDALRNEGFDQKDDESPAYQWAYRPTLDDERGLVAIAEDRKALEIADEFWPFFVNYCERVLATNRELETGGRPTGG